MILSLLGLHFPSVMFDELPSRHHHYHQHQSPTHPLNNNKQSNKIRVTPLHFSSFSFHLFASLCLIIILLMLPQGQEKRLVQEYKSTNRQLRRQLQNLNTEIDKIIAFKTNRIGLKKLPAVDKNLLQTQDIKLLQVEVDNLRKRLEVLNHDNDVLKERSKINHMIRAKQLEELLATRQAEKKALRKEHYWLDKNSKTLNTTDAIQQEMKLYDKIEQVNQQLIRCRKMQADLQKEADQLKSYEEKKSSYIQQAVETHKGLANTIAASRIQMPITHKSKSVSDQEWKGIKREFLELKQSKQREQTALNQDNDRLRTEIRTLELRLKQKKSTLDNIRSLQIKRKQRNYSTLQNSNPRKQESVRYRNRNNKYSTKT